MKNILKVLSGMSLIIISNVLGHFFPPISIVATPFIVPSAVALCVVSDIPKIIKCVVAAFCLVFNDFLIKTYGGGAHDLEGLGFIHLFAIPALAISLVIVIADSIIDLYIDFKKTYIFSIIGIIIFFSTIYFYADYFSSYGMTYKKPNSYSVIESKKRNNFVSSYEILDSLIVSNNDTFCIKEVWLERIILNSHEQIIKKIEPSNEFYLVTRINHNIDNLNYVYFLDDDSNYSKTLFDRDTLIYFKVDSIKQNYTINLLGLKNNHLNIKIKQKKQLTKLIFNHPQKPFPHS